MNSFVKLNIRCEQQDDEAQIHRVNELAFGQAEEANFIDLLRATCL